MDILAKYTEEEREIARKLRPIDDTLFRTMTKDNIPLVEHIIRVTLNRNDISVLKVNTQDDIHAFEYSHSVILDCLAVDERGTYYDIEVQATKRDDLKKRARYISSMIDAKYTLEKGEENYNVIKDQIVIFLMEEDIFDGGKQLYEFIRTELESKLPLGDGSRIIYVNAENKGREELDNLMQSLVARDYLDMKDDVIKESTMYYKTTVEGEDQVCDIVQSYAAKSYDKGKSDGRSEGRNEVINITVQVLLDFVSSGNISLDDAIKKSKLSRKEFLDIAAQLGFNN